MRLTVLLSENESVPIHLGRHYLKSLSGDPAEPVDEVAYLHEVEREAREFFCHEHFNVTHELDAADINLTLQISQMPHSLNQKNRSSMLLLPVSLVQFGICFEYLFKIKICILHSQTPSK